jgi:thioredoxin-like negative regulator of GroEL
MESSGFSKHRRSSTVTSFALSALLQAAVVSTGAQNYADAHKQMTENGKPLVVLVGADWCPGCRTMKQSAMPQVEKNGGLSQVAFAIVNTDRESALSQKLMSGGSIPQLIMYHQSATGWQRKSLVGAQSPSQIESFIRQGVAAQAQAPVARQVSR